MGLDVSKVKSIEGEWTVSRQAGIGFPPLWLPPLRAHSKPQPDGRWHVEGNGYAQYFAFHEDASWAELVRGEGIRTEEERRHLLFRLWRMQVKECRIADLSDFDLIDESGLEPARFVDDDYSYCQELGAMLLLAGFRGVLAPSAAYPGSTNLTLFGARRECRIDEQNRRPDHYVGCHLVADLAAPPPDILNAVRYREEPHTALYEWEEARTEAA